MFLFWSLFQLFTILMLVTQCKSANRYLLYDNKKNLWPEILSDQLNDTTWKAAGDVKVLVHGFHPVPLLRLPPFQIISRQKIILLAKEYDDLYKKLGLDVNIIVVDWTHLSPNYVKAVENTYTVGIQIAIFLNELKENGYIKDWSQIHMLGHSVGAHVCGTTGFGIQQLQNGQKIGRITGLDPAGPGFNTPDKELPGDMTTVLDYTDADLVDTIHTNMASSGELSLLHGELGSELATAHVDFYPNGGRHMPECNDKSDKMSACSHLMSVLYFAFALRNYDKKELLTACPCASYFHYTLGLCECNEENGQVIGHFTKPIPEDDRKNMYLTLTHNS